LTDARGQILPFCALVSCCTRPQASKFLMNAPSGNCRRAGPVLPRTPFLDSFRVADNTPTIYMQGPEQLISGEKVSKRKGLS
jgi:hypothetical protein